MEKLTPRQSLWEEFVKFKEEQQERLVGSADQEVIYEGLKDDESLCICTSKEVKGWCQSTSCRPIRLQVIE